MKVSFKIAGEPHGKGRPRFAKRGEFTKAYTPQKTVVYENLIRLEYQRQCGEQKFDDKDMLDLRVMAYLAIPESASQKKKVSMETGVIRPTKKPDLDNILKVVADSLNHVAYRDDAQIVDSQIRKFYSQHPRLEVTIQSV